MFEFITFLGIELEVLKREGKEKTELLLSELGLRPSCGSVAKDLRDSALKRLSLIPPAVFAA
jgi:hypothetical protein